MVCKYTLSHDNIIYYRVVRNSQSNICMHSILVFFNYNNTESVTMATSLPYIEKNIS